MDIISNLGTILGTSWASGINLYMTIAALGLMDRSGAIDLPGRLEILSNPLVIAAAVFMFLIEFFADKIPYVDSAWDSVHTVIRPAGSSIMAYMAFAQSPEAVQLSAALLSGGIALDAHLTKATARMAINTSPEPVTNSVASVTEDGLVAVALWLVVTHPVIAAVLVISFIVFSVWFLKVMYRFLKKVFSFLAGRDKEEREKNPRSSVEKEG
jgi:hypothetical protein